MSSATRSGDNRSGSPVHDNALTVDFRERPTRAEVGLADGDSTRSYQRTGPMLDASVVLPTGTVRLPCFVVSVSTDNSGGAALTPGSEHHDPKYFTFERRFESATAAQGSLLDDAAVLGLRRDEVEFVSRQLGHGGGTASPQARVLHGLVRDWLSVQVSLRDDDAGQVQAVYEIDIDVFHNPAVDKVVHDGVYALDLGHRPSRADLAFLDGYPSAVVQPAWGTSITTRLTLPGGTIAVPTALVRSGADDAAAAPRYTDIAASTATLEDARARLLGQAAALGLDRAKVEAAFTGTSGQLHRTTLIAPATSVYALTVKVEATPGQAGPYAASVTYQFTYR